MKYHSEYPANGNYIIHSANISTGFSVTNAEIGLQSSLGIVENGINSLDLENNTFGSVRTTGNDGNTGNAGGGDSNGDNGNGSTAKSVDSYNTTIPADDVLLFLRVQRLSTMGLRSIAEVQEPLWCSLGDNDGSEYTARQLEFASSSPVGRSPMPACKLPQLCTYLANSNDEEVQYGGLNCDSNITLFGLEPGRTVTFSGKHYDDVFTVNYRGTIFKNSPGDDNGACNNTLGETICNDCYKQMDVLEILAYTGIYSQLLGALFAISRCKDSNNSILIHVLATGATAIAFSSMLAALIAFHSKCFYRYDSNTQDDDPDVWTYLVRTGVAVMGGGGGSMGLGRWLCACVRVRVCACAQVYACVCACACTCACMCVRVRACIFM